MMTHGSLFSGIGGFDLAAEWMGWKNLFHCEWNEFGQKVLKYYWPDAELFTDITKSNFTKYANKIDILTGGFPCQPYSQAGKRLGKDDERHLWPEMLRVIQEVKPTYIVGENVRGLTNWNGGVVFEEVCVDLENCGYEVQPVLLPACAVNAPHRRDRIWFVAYNNQFRCERYAEQIRNRDYSQEQIRSLNIYTKQGWDEVRSINDGNCENKRHVTNSNSNGFNECDSEHEINSSEGGQYAQCNIEQMGEYDAADTECIRLEHGTNTRQIQGKEKTTKRKGSKSTLPIKTNGNGHKSNWENFPIVSPVCDGDDGISNRLDGITFPKWRNESIKAGGNAIVPQIALQIFKTIQQHENNKTKASANV